VVPEVVPSCSESTASAIEHPFSRCYNPLIKVTVNKSRGLADQAALIAAGEVASAEIVDAALKRIEASRETINAFRVVRDGTAVREAEEADRRVAAGERLPLLGVPIAIKDDTDLAGHPTAYGCPGEFEPKGEDSVVAAKLKAAGAVIVGKTNSPEIGLWPFTEGPAFGVTRNPWNLDHSPGGSSGGSAAAVSAGLIPAAVGSDGAGSVRIPAGWTNLVGVKPQRGRISTWPDPEAFNGLTVVGPLTHTVADAALLLDVLSGNVVGDLHRPPPPAETFIAAAARPPGRLRIALSLNIPYSGAPASLDAGVRASVERIATVLEGLGHEVETTDVPYGLWAGASIMPRSMAAIREWTGQVPDRSLLDPRVIESARHGRMLRPLLPVARLAERIGHRVVGRIFRRFDMVLAPTTAQPPLRIGACEGLSNWETDKAVVAACPYAWPWNVLGWPGVNVPAGFTEGGLPIGAQLLGPANSEPRLLSVAAQLEESERWYERRPPPFAAGQVSAGGDPK
jgi:amidase